MSYVVVMLGVFEIAASGGCARVCVRVRARCPSPKEMEWCGRREKEKILTGRIMSGGDGQFEDAESQPSRLGV